VSEIALFHSALGLRPSEHAFADRLRAAGHTVHTPDLYEGRTFDSLDDGVAHGDGLGLDEIGRRAATAVEPLRPDLVYAGFSLGACAAQILAQRRPGASGALLYHAALPSEPFGGWPAGVRLQIHSMEDDEWFEVDVARALADEAGGELYLYPGSAHLFADPDQMDYDEAAAELMIARTLVFLK
jgi:dienelactone hydrolase